jgi:hypothetical protein
VNGTPELNYKIGMLAPSRVGKTTLITSMLTEGQTMLAQTPVALRTAGASTANKLAISDGVIRGALRKRTFEPDHVPSTPDPFVFKLRLEPRTDDVPVLFEILDYPGAWLEQSGEKNPTAWEECQSFLRDATVLLIPIDSVLLMEAVKDYSKVLPQQLAIHQLEQLVRDWAKERQGQRGKEPALAVFCPLKCESYLADNGGLRDQSELLRNRAMEEYRGVIRAIREEAGHATLRYLPIDTFGCVELASARWEADPKAAGGYKCLPRYLVRPPGQLRRVGLEDLVVLLCQQLVESARLTSQTHADFQGIAAANARSYAELREGIFRDWWLKISGQRRERVRVADLRGAEYRQALGQTASLADVLAALSGREAGPRLSYIS